ncbi:hypothetical protein [Lysobacter sp. CFH 32150]|uniref:hypothetical protein n=1 Tax=Lysobacter sp. CFH 32150 TaxID=2927128 RepID=UPI001FA7A086|nr:hypothetical protein [Lysobacter sp. CFH 32150]MCI4566699.1 hypothetical protein [Lysobacter sp. CFH 32150]
MTEANGTRLTFTELERRIQELPEGPVSALNTPRWIFVLNTVGLLSAVIAMVPMLLIKIFEPAMWMVHMARWGVWIAWIVLLPSIVRGVWLILRSFLRWKAEMVEQLDHDFTQFNTLQEWLSRIPTPFVVEHLRFAQVGQARLAAKLSFLAGSLDKLGVLPVLVAMTIQINAIKDINKVPSWQILLAMFLLLAYSAALMGSLMRIRLHLYEVVLSDSLQARNDA